MSADDLQFFQLLDNLMSLDNAVRQQAEVIFYSLLLKYKQNFIRPNLNQYNTILKATYSTIPFDAKLVFLVKCMRNTSLQSASRTLALVMLRRLISTSVEDNWSGLDEQIKQTLKLELLSAVQQETDKSIRKKITDVIAELARFLIGILNSKNI